MDPQNQTVQAPPVIPPKPPFPVKWIIAGIIIIFLIIIGGIFTYTKSKQTPAPTTETGTARAILKVGDELIYAADLDTELSYHPDPDKESIKKTLTDKLIKDSVILQGAKTDKLVSLDSSVYNSPQKDYLKRIELVKQAEKEVEAKSDSISGSVISIWFYNIKLGSLPYEQAKQLALAKITRLHDDVKNGKITIEEAAETIKNDASLAQIDKAYKSNAIFTFQAKQGEKITFIPEFDNLIRKLKEEEVSQVYLGQDTVSSKGKIDALYMFAKVTKRVSDNKYQGFTRWLEQKQKAMKVQYL